MLLRIFSKKNYKFFFLNLLSFNFFYLIQLFYVYNEKHQQNSAQLY